MAQVNVMTVIEMVVFYIDPKSHGETTNTYLGGKERRRIQINENEMKHFSLFQEAIVKKCALREEAMERGMGRDVTVKIGRIDKDQRQGSRCFTINNQDSFDLEKKELSNSILQGKNCFSI